MRKDGRSKDNPEGNPRASDEGQASDGQSRENPLPSDDGEASWTDVVNRSKKQSQRQLQNYRSNPVRTITGSPGVSSSQRSNSSNPGPMPTVVSSSNPSTHIQGSSSAPAGRSASRPWLQSNTRNPTTVSRGTAEDSNPRSQFNNRGSSSTGTRTAIQGSSSSSNPNNLVDLYCNHFEVQFRKQPLPIIYQYTVTIDSKRYSSVTQDTKLSEVKSEALKRKIFKALRQRKPDLNSSAYDGDSGLYSTRLLKSDILNEPNEVLLPRNVNPGWRSENRAGTSRQPDELVYVVTVQQSQSNPREGRSFPSQHTSHGEPGPNDKIFLQALSIFLLESSSASEGVHRVGSNYYSKPPEENARNKVSENVVVWEGFHSSFRLTYAAPNDPVPRLVLNHSDVMTAVLVPKSVEDFIRDLLQTNLGRRNFAMEILRDNWQNDRRIARTARNLVNAALSGVRVQTTCGKYLRNYTVRELTSRTSIEHRFQVKKRKENGEISEETVNVRDHFLSHHEHTLQRPDWPLLCMNGGESGPAYIPIEVCTILDRQRYMRFSADERNKFLNMGKISPGGKKTKIERSLNHKAETYEARDNPFGEAFGIQIKRSMINVEGQVLAPPMLYFLNDTRMDWTRSEPGQWNFRSHKLANPVRLNNHVWAIYVFFSGNDGDSQGSSLSEDLRKMFRSMGMVVNPGTPPYYLETQNQSFGNPDERIQIMLDTIEQMRNLIVAVLPSKSPELYVPLKKLCETTNGGRSVITQCVFMGKSTMLNAQHLANLALKVNLKMGGFNSNVNLDSILGNMPTCIFGIDVSHGSTKDTDKPSIAAVVASVENRIWSRYAPEVRKQAANQERVEHLQEMVMDLLNEFHRNSGHYPRQIIVYRDGVSESQFQNVGQAELNDFKRACEGVNPNIRRLDIPITFIIVQKRHHTRFFKRGRGETFENMTPGTVVTSQVCQTQDKDFYLCSHQSFIKAPAGGPGVTSRPAHYTILSDEINLGQANIYNLTNHLCYCFGRATKAVSIPAPVYYAHVAAKHYSCFMDRDPASGATTLRNINNRLKNAPYRMFYT